MKKTFITSFIFCFFCGVLSFNASAQEYKYDISKYYTPDIVRNQLDLSVSSSGSLNSTLNTSNDNAINGNLNANFSNYVNTRKLIRTINANLLLNGSASSENNLTTGINQQSGHFYNSAGVGTTYQLFNPTNKFLSFGGNINYGYNISSNKIDSLNKADIVKYNLLSSNLNLYIGVGFGRIENVTDAQQAIYLLEAFSKNNVLGRDLSNNEIFNLSQEISRIKNKRFLDARLHLIDEVSHVDSFLVANNLIKKSDANYFTTLYDIWLYGDRFERKSGQSIELRFTPNIRFDNSYSKIAYEFTNHSDLEGKGNSLYSNYNISLIYNFEKPFNQKWQHSVNASLNGVLNNSSYTSTSILPLNNESKSAYNSKYANANASYKLGYYPNTRTNIYAQINQAVEYDFYTSSTINGNQQVNNEKILSSNTSLDFGTYYYFSPQLRLSANLNLSNNHQVYYNSSYPVSNVLNGQFSVGANYSFF